MDNWYPISEAVVDGTQCALRFRDALGYYEVKGPFFLHDDGLWYGVNPPHIVVATATHFRPLMADEI